MECSFVNVYTTVIVYTCTRAHPYKRYSSSRQAVASPQSQYPSVLLQPVATVVRPSVVVSSTTTTRSCMKDELSITPRARDAAPRPPPLAGANPRSRD